MFPLISPKTNLQPLEGGVVPVKHALETFKQTNKKTRVKHNTGSEDVLKIYIINVSFPEPCPFTTMKVSDMDTKEWEITQL